MVKGGYGSTVVPVEGGHYPAYSTPGVGQGGDCFLSDVGTPAEAHTGSDSV